MAIATGTLLALAAGLGVAGAVAGSQPDKVEQTSTSNSTSTGTQSQSTQNSFRNSQTNQSLSGLNLGEASLLEQLGQAGMLSNYGSLDNIVSQGPGASDAAASTGAQRDLASLLQGLSESGGAPTGQDIGRANSFADQLFAARQTELNQAFERQGQQANQQAALMGRSFNDPILRAKLAQQQVGMQSSLDAEKGGFAAQFAQQLPLQRLQFAQGRADVLGGLATQAMANRQALLSMGGNMLQNERGFRINTAQQYSNSSGTQSGSSNSLTNGTFSNNTSGTGTQTQMSGGGIGGAINGFIGGFGSGIGL